ncbi:MAG: aminotransferase DegT [Candidatus Endolissoclinum sp. TMED37]|nr:MAG: aminotransferase DegT [Candidatus Endolissoclinum sp. TMED37]
MNIPFIDLKTQYTSISEKVEKRIKAVLEHGQYIMGPEVLEIETLLAHRVGATNCITVSSGTDALLISLMALGIGRGDEVITTNYSFVSTVEVIVLCGATPVFVDIEPETCNIDATLIEDKITERTKAIIPVSLYGQTADMDAINDIAARNGNLAVIEDGAQSFGATYKGKSSCNLSTIGCTSFFPSKPLGCYGDGGAIFTSDNNLAKICKEIRVHGQSKKYTHERVGLGGRMDTLQCAILLAKIETFDQELDNRQRIAERYNNALSRLGMDTITTKKDRTSVHAQYTLILENRDLVQSKLGDSNIPTTIHYPSSLDQQKPYKRYNDGSNSSMAQRLSKRALSIPMSPYLSEKDQDYIIEVLSKC